MHFHQTIFTTLVIGLVGVGALFPASSSAKEPTAEQLEFFENKIRPVLVEHCYECHSPDAKTLQGGLSLHTAAGLLRGGDSGPSLVPHKPEQGTILESLRYESFEMPPTGQLPEHVIEDFQTWIEMGAPDPRTGPALSQAESIDLAAGREFWAFKSPIRIEPPSVSDPSWNHHPIDAFIEAAREQHGLQPSPPGSRQVLIRRLYYDLIGLPPTPEQISQFVENESDHVIETLVDELLARPEFGERWGRHWLDVARYADSTGGGRSRLYGNSWRYRDYVIDSFNQDKPYHQFIQEQLAGDLLPAESLEQSHEQLTACGFLMLGPHNYELQDKALLRMEVVDEQITTLGKAFLGMTIGCARCHDHKFDPIPMTDYYALAGIFRSTKSLGTGNVTNWITQQLPLEPEQQQQFDQHRQQVKELETERARIESKLKKLDAKVLSKSIPVTQLAGIVLDSEQQGAHIELIGDWKSSTSVSSYVQANYLHDQNEAKGEKFARFHFQLPSAGKYEVRLSYTANPNRARKVPVTILSAGQELATAVVNQQQTPKIDGSFVSLGIHSFEFNSAGEVTATIEIATHGTSGVVIADAVQLISAELLRSQPHQVSSSLKQTRERTPEELANIDQLKQQKQELTDQLNELKNIGPEEPPNVMAVQEEIDEECGDMHLCIRGNIRNLGPVVPRGVLSVTVPQNQHTIQTTHSGRLELAEWIASKQNPLTARVMVNRIWSKLFGNGLVRTVDNFGTTGETPSHPELLDHLAIRFMESGWSLKSIIREIVLTRTYQQSSRFTSAQQNLDPENRMLAHFPKRRADAEYLRDALLVISGTLQSHSGGPTVKPGTRSEFDYEYTGQQRSVYLPVFRNKIHELLVVYDFPDPNLVQGHRTRNTLATQALFMMNHPSMLEFSQATAQRLLDQPNRSDHQRLDWLSQYALGRKPTESEHTLYQNYLNNIRQTDSDSARSELWSSLCQAVFCSIDFRYIE